MMRAGVAVIGVVAGLALTACGEAADAPAAAPVAGAEVAAAAPAGVSMSVPAGLPAYLAPIDGAKIVQGTSHGGMQTLEYNVDKPMADVVAFHRDAIKAAGKTPATDMGTSDGHSITLAEAPAVSITFSGAGAGSTHVAIMSSE